MMTWEKVTTSTRPRGPRRQGYVAVCSWSNLGGTHGCGISGKFSRNDYRHTQIIARKMLSTVMLIINKNVETTPMPPIRG